VNHRLNTATVPRPHDLLWIEGPGSLVADEPLPFWVRAVLGDLPVVVVRRSRQLDGLVPVGIRGRSREERFAAAIPVARVVRRVAPEDLLTTRHEPTRERADAIAALRAFLQVEKVWAELGLPWGPTGSVGFEMATGAPATTQASDLDIVMRAVSPLTVREGRDILAAVEQIAAVADIQVETPAGSFALREYCNGKSLRYLLKTLDGPRLVTDPWESEQGDFE
jgi:phosphoribosyl-dephospho-CoA transferase